MSTYSLLSLGQGLSLRVGPSVRVCHKLYKSGRLLLGATQVPQGATSATLCGTFSSIDLLCLYCPSEPNYNHAVSLSVGQSIRRFVDPSIRRLSNFYLYKGFMEISRWALTTVFGK